MRNPHCTSTQKHGTHLPFVRMNLLQGRSPLTTRLNIAREVAYDAFSQVMEHQKNPDAAVEYLLQKRHGSVTKRDRRLIKELLFGSLRWYSKIYWILQKTSSRDLNSTTPEIRASLILGTYQIFYMDHIPDRAAVNESVEYVRHKGQTHAVSFVNGILRSIARKAEYFAKPDKDKQPAEYLALQYAHPQWIVDRWLRYFSFDRMKDLLLSNNVPPPFAIRVNTCKIPKEKIQEFRDELLRSEKVHSEKPALRSCLLLTPTPPMDAASLFGRGFYTVQGEASQLIAHLVAPQPETCIVDACCGPAGKLSHLFEEVQGSATLIGLDPNPIQIRRATETLTRLGHVGITLLEQDFLTYRPTHPVDKVLVDAPCSGLGVLRKHPEGKWQKKPELIDRMATEQRKFLQHGFSLLQAGGELIYSVCSFEREETVAQLSWMLDEYAGKIELVSPVQRLPDYYKRFVTRDNLLLIYSGNKDNMDGFGAFIVRKR